MGGATKGATGARPHNHQLRVQLHAHLEGEVEHGERFLSVCEELGQLSLPERPLLLARCSPLTK